jgi:hypothetical protein
LIFQFPVILALAEKFGFIDGSFIIRKRKAFYAVFTGLSGLVVSFDIIGQLMSVGCIFFLYEITLIFVLFSREVTFRRVPELRRAPESNHCGIVFSSRGRQLAFGPLDSVSRRAQHGPLPDAAKANKAKQSKNHIYLNPNIL